MDFIAVGGRRPERSDSAETVEQERRLEMAGRLVSLQLATAGWEATSSDPEFYIAGQ